MRARTLKQLAESLDVSITTVSRALAGHEQIALRTRQRVLKAAEELGYVPNGAARALVSGRSNFVGLVLPIRGPNLVDSFLGEFVTGLGEGLVSRGNDLMLATVPEGKDELQVLSHVVESGRADGIVLTRIAEADQRVAYLAERRFPFITHGRLVNSRTAHNWLDTDGASAFAEAFDMLYELGHRRFGLVTISDDMTFRHLREAGLTTAIEKRGDPEVSLQIVRAPRFDKRARAEGIARLLGDDSRPTAVIGLFDELALNVMEMGVQMGLDVPGDLSVIGFDNVLAANYAPPGLTTFDALVRKVAREAGEMLVDVIRNPDDGPVSRLIRPELILRGSHGPVPKLT